MGEPRVRGVRGATTVDSNAAEEIRAATRELLLAMLKCNDLREQDMISIVFTATPDLDAAFPAAAARELGWHFVPLLDAVEINAVGALARCVRVLMHVYTDREAHGVQHVYLRGARVLRPDLS